LTKTFWNLGRSADNTYFFPQIHTPILTSNDCEGAGEVFKVLPARKDAIKIMKKADTQVLEFHFRSHGSQNFFTEVAYLNLMEPLKA
jgi:aspartyl/asparaginyl-tRNA synthetase